MEAAIPSCYYCSLPITGKPVTARVGGNEQSFCCHGCIIVYCVMGRRGEPGQSATVLARLLVGGVLAMAVMAISWSTYINSLFGGGGGGRGLDQPDFLLYRVYLPLVATVATVVLGYPIVVGALRGLRGRRLGLDSLIALGVTGAYVLSLISTITGVGQVFYDTAVAILFLVTLGRYLEAQAKARTAEEVRGLFALTPQTATVLRGGGEEQVDAAALVPGDFVRVVAGQAFPADGRVIAGEGGVNEGALTGEEAPVFKRAGDSVLAGTIDFDGSFVVAVERVRDRTVVSQVAHLMEQARQSHGPLVRLSDRVAAVLTPISLSLAAGAFVYWTLADGVGRGLMVSLSVLLITCPCSVGIATPLAIWIGLAEAARRGVLLRSGEVMERLGKVQHVFFDKTGTVTTGALSLVDSVAADGWHGREDEMLASAASISRQSVHPIAGALLKRSFGGMSASVNVEDARYRPGLGAEGVIDGRRFVVGSRELMERSGLVIQEELTREEARRAALAQSVAYVGSDGIVCGLLSFSSRLRDGAAEAAGSLRRMGIRVSLLTGDGEPQARWASQQLGIEDLRWGLMPQDKVSAITSARAAGESVMMVGDGINDAPSLAGADVGVAIGSGADLAQRAADITFIGSNLAHVAWSLGLARRVRRTTFTNLIWSGLYNSIGLILAATGLLAPWMSAIIMVISSLFVVGNSLRLRTGDEVR